MHLIPRSCLDRGQSYRNGHWQKSIELCTTLCTDISLSHYLDFHLALAAFEAISDLFFLLKFLRASDTALQTPEPPQGHGLRILPIISRPRLRSRLRRRPIDDRLRPLVHVSGPLSLA